MRWSSFRKINNRVREYYLLLTATSVNYFPVIRLFIYSRGQCTTFRLCRLLYLRGEALKKHASAPLTKVSWAVTLTSPNITLQPQTGRKITAKMATSVEAKMLKSTKFPPEFNQKVDMQKVNLEVMKRCGACLLCHARG